MQGSTCHLYPEFAPRVDVSFALKVQYLTCHWRPGLTCRMHASVNNWHIIYNQCCCVICTHGLSSTCHQHLSYTTSSLMGYCRHAVSFTSLYEMSFAPIIRTHRTKCHLHVICTLTDMSFASLLTCHLHP